MRSTNLGIHKLALMTVLLGSFSAHAGTASFVPSGGSCMSQSSWTQKALEQTEVIAQTLQALRTDPNCKGMAESIGSGKLLGLPENFQGAEGTFRTETIMQELAALRDVLLEKRNTEAAAQLNPVVADATIETMSAISSENQSTVNGEAVRNFKGRLQNASAQGIQILSSLFQTLPQNEECMEKRPDLTAALIMGGIKVGSAFAMGDMGMSVQIAELTANFLTYLKDIKFSKIQKNLNEQKLWSEISCLTESAQASYCAVQDGFSLTRIQTQLSNSNFVNSPLEGFHLMSREVPKVTNWLESSVQKLGLNETSDSEEIALKLSQIDQLNLTDESVAGTSESVRTSLTRIRGYLSRLYTHLEKRTDSRPILLSIIDAASRIDRVLAKLRALDAEAQAMGIMVRNGNYRLSDLSNYSEEEREAHLGKFTDFVQTLIKEFNIKTQGSNFLLNRMQTYVRHEYDVRLKNEDFSRYTNQLLASARGTIMEKLKEYDQFNIAEVQTDLAQASTIHMANLDALEALAIGHYEDYLVHLNERAGHSFRCVSKSAFNWRSILGLDIFSMPSDCTFFEAKQDLNNEAETIRGKVCLQTLGFSNYKRFYQLCQGAVLKSTQVTNGRSVKGLTLEYKYNELYRKRVSEEPFSARWLGQDAPNRYSQVCLLRDYFRNNFVHWLTLRYQEKN